MDHPDHRRYARDLRLLGLPAVTVRGSVSHAEVLQILAHSHVQVMTSLDDTFGYSVIEGYAMGTPAITTNVCALAETVLPGETGFRVDLPIDEWGNWIYRDERDRPDYWDILDTTYDDLAAQVVARLEELVDEPRMHGALSEGALQRARSHHDPRRTSAALDELYDRALA
jgi:glycosyltransferase involved in cell wall biosynthesis